MGNLIGVGTITLTDLNDAIVTDGTPPKDPEPGTLWIDTSGGTDVLKKWQGDQWIKVHLDVSELDPDMAETVDSIQHTLGTMAEDGVLNYSDRLVLVQDISRIIGEVPSTSSSIEYPNSLPDYTSLDAEGIGTFGRYRLNARDVGIDTQSTVYTDVQDAYEDLNAYLSSKSPRPWDIRESQKEKVTNLSGGDLFREKFLTYYLAELALVTETEKVAREKAEELAKDMVSDTVSTVEGRLPIVATPSQEGGSLHVSMEGESYQKAGRGKNIFYPRSSAPKTDYTYDGDPVYLIRGYWVQLSEQLVVPPNTNITISAYVKRESNATGDSVTLHPMQYTTREGNIRSSQPSRVFSISESWRLVEYSFTTHNQTQSMIFHIVGTGTNPGVAIRHIQIELNASRTSYEYPAPAPKYPIKVENPNQSVLVTGEGRPNLVPNAAERYHSPGGDYNFAQYLLEERVSSVTVSGFVEFTDGSSDEVSILLRDNHKNSIYSNSTPVQENGYFEFTREVNRDVFEVLIYIGNLGSTRGNGGYFRKVKVEEGTSSTPWVPHLSEVEDGEKRGGLAKTRLSLKEPLLSAGGTSDRLYQDSSNVWKIKKNVEKVVLGKDTQTGWSKSTHSNHSEGIVVYWTGAYSHYNMYEYTEEMKCTHFNFHSGTWAGLDEGEFSRNAPPGVIGHNLYFAVREEDFPTTDSFKEWLIEEENGETPVTVYFEAQNKEEITLPQKTQDVLNSIPSFKDQTYVYLLSDNDNSIPAEVKVEAKSNSWFREYQSKKYTDDTSAKQGSALDTSVSNGHLIPSLTETTYDNFTIEALVFWKGTVGEDSGGIIGRDSPGLSLDFRNWNHGAGRSSIRFLNEGVEVHTGNSAHRVGSRDNAGVKLNRWHRVSVTADGSNYFIYVDGELHAQAAVSKPLNLEGAFIGTGINKAFQGYVSDFRVWDRALSEEEINRYLAFSLSGTEEGLILNYKMNGGNVLFDSSPSQNHIELDRNVHWVDSASTLREFQDSVTNEIDDKIGDSETELITTFDAMTENLGSSIRESVTQLVTDTEGRIVDTLSSEMNKSAESYDLTFSALEDSLNSAHSDLTEVKTYFSFTNDGAFSIGSSDSSYSIQMTQDRLSFMDGDSEVAFISNNNMQITSGIFVESLTIGSHKFDTIGGDILVLRWMGNS